MRKPSGLAGLVGRPIVTLAALGVEAFGLYIWYCNPEALLIGITSLVMMGWTVKANAKVAEYRAWKRAWDDMGPGGARRLAADHPVIRVGVFLAIAAGIGAYLYSDADQPGFQFALGWLGVGFAVLLLVGLARLGRRTIRSVPGSRRPITRQAIVAICVGRPVIRVPSLKGAYGALPAHCWRVLGGPGG